MNNGSNTSNHHPLHPRDDRETLSALFDGALPGDAARFALKRLDHDAGWRDTCGRWQLIGDALRGEATSAAPADFAASVMRKLVAEGAVPVAASPVAPVAASPAAVTTRRRWIGGAALAASVAMVAVLVARPFSQSPTGAPPQVAGGVVAPATAPIRATQGAEAVPTISPAASSTAAASLAVADAPRPQPVAAHRVERPAHSTPRPIPSTASDDGSRVVAVAEATATRKPFHPPIDDVATRPWPRAVLPDAGAGAFSVSFDPGVTPASSYYPFEPRLPEAAAAKPPATEPQH
ncbi:sigma-E factor negative regulatory protein [Lysobacter tyrosinilyticus]